MFTMYGLKYWVMKFIYNASKKYGIQQEKQDVRDDTTVCLKDILKRLSDLEIIVHDQENLLIEKMLIIEDNNERIGILERVVQEINRNSLVCYVNFAVVRILCGLTKTDIYHDFTHANFVILRRLFSKITLQEVITSIDSSWTEENFFEAVNSIITTYQDKTIHVVYKEHTTDVLVEEALKMIESCPENIRLLFSSEEKILRSYEELEELNDYLLRWDKKNNQYDTR